MEYDKLCDQILDLDPQIRFSGILNSRGDLVLQKNKNGEPLLSGDEVKMAVHYTFERWNRLQNLEHKLGKEKVSFTEYDNVIMISLVVNKDLLLVSTEPNSDYSKIISSIKKIINN